MPSPTDALANLPLRDDLVGLHPYGAPQLDVPILLNVNENTFGVPADVHSAIVEAVSAATQGLNRYPDREFTELRANLARYLGHGLGPDQLWAANGSNEVLQQVLQAFGGPGRTAIGFPPTYSMYPLLASGTGTRYVTAARGAAFSMTPDDTARAVRESGANVVFLCSPNNPTGTALELGVIEAAYDAGEDARAIIVVDEAYGEFAQEGTPSALSLLPGRPRLLVSRTMSKAFALAGARLGYLAAAPEISDALRLVRLPYHLSAITQAAANAALTHADTLLSNVEAIKVQRDRIVAELTSLGLSPAPSDANFVFFSGLEDPRRIWEGLLAAGVLIRDVGIPGSLRVTAGTEEETTVFLSTLRTLL
ncbi:histidinol-phosphate transaminase [Arthrobacter agilis]|uniref:histidinol-phosphate transaminase n=1 Tax=Arthrobacter agilis TaxID=37921 RepID=UPI002365F031|nr:histidinol-phosphate transaminase [Arthrobacter agilis]WDF34424.1 histidinol-phosphate transaminase [Arthrobacter agilis]